MKRVLSIDGGGVRGIVPASLLSKLEELASQPCWKIFDLIVGTSTGGLLGALLATGRSASDSVEFYRRDAAKIFGRNFLEDIDRLGLLESKYGSTGISEVLEATFGDTLLCSAKTKLMLTSFDLQKQDTHFFKSWKDQVATMVDACRATSAAPTYFPPSGVLIDGGVACNNPTMCGCAESCTLWPHEEYRVLSLGTGAPPPSSFHAPRLSGIFGWLPEINEVLLNAPLGMVPYQAAAIIPFYMRVQPSLGTIDPAMFDALPAHLDDLVSDAEGCYPEMEKAWRFLQ